MVYFYSKYCPYLLSQDFRHIALWASSEPLRELRNKPLFNLRQCNFLAPLSMPQDILSSSYLVWFGYEVSSFPLILNVHYLVQGLNLNLLCYHVMNYCFKPLRHSPYYVYCLIVTCNLRFEIVYRVMKYSMIPQLAMWNLFTLMSTISLSFPKFYNFFEFENYLCQLMSNLWVSFFQKIQFSTIATYLRF